MDPAERADENPGGCLRSEKARSVAAVHDCLEICIRIGASAGAYSPMQVWERPIAQRGMVVETALTVRRALRRARVPERGFSSSITL